MGLRLYIKDNILELLIEKTGIEKEQIKEEIIQLLKDIVTGTKKSRLWNV